MSRRRLLVASAHRHPDLARLWWHFVRARLLPALAASGRETAVTIYCDAGRDGFDPELFDGAALESPRAEARDFVEWLDRLVARDTDEVFLLDADVLVLDGPGLAAFASRLDEPDVAAVSFVRRTSQPGVFALWLCAADYRALAHPVFAPSQERIEAWPRTLNRQPGDRAAIALRARGRTIIDVPPAAAAPLLADFHATTTIRRARELARECNTERPFLDLLAHRPYLAMGAFDNILLGELHRALFARPFAPGPDGRHLSGSVTLEELRTGLRRLHHPARLAATAAAFERSAALFARVQSSAGLDLTAPFPLPPARRRLARALAKLWRFLPGKPRSAAHDAA